MIDDARAALAALIAERREDYANLSAVIGRNPSYVQQYLNRGSPRRLAEEDRRRLAEYFGVSEEKLGGPPAPPPADDLVHVPLFDVGAAAGQGRETDRERQAGRLAFPRPMLRDLASGGTDGLSLIRVEGASMEPQIRDGDHILVDRRDGADRLRDGVYVLRLDDRLVVKRVVLGPVRGRVDIVSDNPAFPSWPGTAVADLAVIGRVRWSGGVVR
ncbi:MAG: peptidase S24 [Sphingomonas fennica]